jgi:sugar (pentulose or hexulose) kinase
VPQELVLGIDVGTTETKVVAVGLDGRLLGRGGRPTAWEPRGDGGAEIAPLALLDGVVGACIDALDRVSTDPATVRLVGIGVTGMAEAGVLLDADGSSVLPVIAWFDPRGQEQIDRLDPAFVAAFPARTGLPMTALPTFSKLLWMVDEYEMGWAGRRWLNVPEFVVHALGGDQTSEPSLASRTGFLDQDTLAPFDEALAMLGADAGLLPSIRPAGTPVGRVGPSAPGRLRGAVLTVAGHDHPVASVAAGALGGDDLFDSCGTAEAFIRITERVITPDERVRLSRENVTQGAHVLVGRRILLGGTRGGLLLRRTLAMLGVDTPAARDALDAACPVGAVDLPVHVVGGRLDDHTTVFRVDGDDVSPALVWRAALEAVAEQADALVRVFEDAVGPPARIIAAGGWTRMPSYRAIKQRNFPDIAFTKVEQPGGLGAAAIAAFAAAGHDDASSLSSFVASFLADPAVSADVVTS